MWAGHPWREALPSTAKRYRGLGSSEEHPLHAEFAPGTVLWYRLDTDRGVVKTDAGRQYFIDARSGIDGPIRGLRVLIRERTGEPGPKKAELKLPPHGRELVDLAPVGPPKPKPMARRKRSTGGGAGSRAPSRTKAPKTPKGVVKRVKRRGEAFERGISVLHTVHGQGFIVLSTSSVARVKFEGEERSVRVADLEVLERV